jgi:hypothetical protein
LPGHLTRLAAHSTPSRRGDTARQIMKFSHEFSWFARASHKKKPGKPGLFSKLEVI